MQSAIPSTYDGRQFHHLRYFNEPGLFSGITMKKCELFGRVFGHQSHTSRPVRVIDTTVTGSKFVNNAVVGVRFEDVTITNSTTGAPTARCHPRSAAQAAIFSSARFRRGPRPRTIAATWLTSRSPS
ncbi:hypothetical protein [Amycolatopsis sp. NPDC051903]|uniref:hypothetical protein n=1 Tax=Amycolatopsis sp. NPDC051903 TaxID=3363936 RepID=UPI00378ADD86